MNVGFLFFIYIIINSFYLVKHIHFLQLRALKSRWEEEHVLLKYEMQWTVLYFLNEAEKWKIGGNSESIAVDAKAYALRQEARWRMMALNSDNTFKKTTSDYVSPISPLFQII